MISLNDYFGPWEGTPAEHAYADLLLERVNALLIEAEAHGVELDINPVTKTYVAGEQYGGFRPESCTVGAVHSSHKLARAVDVFDPRNTLDNWITDSWLEEFGLYREAPSATNRWCHLTDKPPGSGKRTFFP